MSDVPRVLSLCSGIGGIDLAAQWAGFEIAGQVEIDDYCQQVLAKHWPDVPKMRDIYDVQGNEFGDIDIIAGGIPCQPFSFTGKRRGQEDDRHLWPEMCRIIARSKPTWALIENVVGFISLALETVLTHLENQGYQCQTFVFPACAIGAPHRRDRAFIVAYIASQRFAPSPVSTSPVQEKSSTTHSFSLRNAPQRRLSQSTMVRTTYGISSRLDSHRWPAYPGEPVKSWEEQSIIDRRMLSITKRIHALGNAVVPQQIYPILAGIASFYSSSHS